MRREYIRVEGEGRERAKEEKEVGCLSRLVYGIFNETWMGWEGEQTTAMGRLLIFRFFSSFPFFSFSVPPTGFSLLRTLDISVHVFGRGKGKGDGSDIAHDGDPVFFFPQVFFSSYVLVMGWAVLRFSSGTFV